MTETVREPINIDPTVKDNLNRFLMSADVPRGFGFSAFISWAISEADNMLRECEEYGDLQCESHYSAYATDTMCTAKQDFLADLEQAQVAQAERDGRRARQATLA